MPSVRVKENEPFEVAMRRFKRTVEKTGLLTELRAREFYEKPTAERKRKLAAAVKRLHKRLRSQQLPRSSTNRRLATIKESRRAPAAFAVLSATVFCGLPKSSEHDHDDQPQRPDHRRHEERHEGARKRTPGSHSTATRGN